MGTVGNSLIVGTTPGEIREALLGFYAHEQITAQMMRASALRLAGPSEVLLKDAINGFLADADRHAGVLAGRIARLGGDIPGDPSRFAALAPSGSGDAPDPNDLTAFAGFVLERERAAIRFYAAFLDGIRDKDRITWVELFGILKFHVEMEDEIESFIEGANRKGDAR